MFLRVYHKIRHAGGWIGRVSSRRIDRVQGVSSSASVAAAPAFYGSAGPILCRRESRAEKSVRFWRAAGRRPSRALVPLGKGCTVERGEPMGGNTPV